MANENRYYKTAFAESGDKAEVPDVSTGGAVGYDTGFGSDYALPKGAATRKRIERNLFNGFNFGVTKNLKQWQEGLYPTWIEDNGTGVAFSYPIGMVVAHAGQNWISNEAANQEEPGTGSKWIVKFSSVNDLSVIHAFATVADVIASTIVFNVGKELKTIVNNTTTNAGGAYYTVTAGTSPNNANPPLTAGLYAKINVEYEMDVRQAGSTNSEPESIAGPILSLYNAGCRRIFIPNSTIQLSSISIPGAVLIANDCRIVSGSITDGKLEGIRHIYVKPSTEETASCPQLQGSSTNKLVYRLADVAGAAADDISTINVVTKSASGDGFVEQAYKNNGGDGSATSAGVNWALLRSISVTPVYNAVVIKNTVSAESAAHSLLNGIEFAMTPSAKSTYMRNSNGTTTSNFLRAKNVPASGWVEYEVTLAAGDESSRKANVAIYSSAVVSADFKVEVGGVLVHQGPATRKGTQSALWTIPIELTNSATATDSIHTIRITNITGNPLYVVGVNYYRLDQVPDPNTEFDAWKLWLDLDNPFINTSGASDYAIFDTDLDVFTGSFHGGETNVALNFSFDGVAYNLSTFAEFDFHIAQNVSFKQRTDIGGKLTTYITTTNYIDGVQQFRVSMTGNMNCTTFYTMLCPTYREFDYIAHPVYLLNGAATDLQNIGDVQDVVQLRSSTGQYVRHTFTKFDLSSNSRGCCYLDNKEGSPGVVSNRKVYYGPVYANGLNVTNISFETQREFGNGKY